jgi:hypothetical protein
MHKVFEAKSIDLIMQSLSTTIYLVQCRGYRKQTIHFLLDHKHMDFDPILNSFKFQPENALYLIFPHSVILSIKQTIQETATQFRILESDQLYNALMAEYSDLS